MKATRFLMTAATAALIASPALANDPVKTTSGATSPNAVETTMAPAAGSATPGATTATTTTTSTTAASKSARGIWKADANGDGKISKEEWDSWFDSMDTDKDGFVTKAEAYPAAHKHVRHTATTTTTAKGSTSTPAANNEATSKPAPSTPAGADGAGGSTAQ